MTNTTDEEQVLKTDVLGRVKTPKDRREALLDEFEKSGMSGKRFAELAGIKYPTFASWAQRRRRERKQYPALKAPAKALPKAHWLEAVVEKAGLPKGADRAVVVIHLPGGARMEIADAHQAALAAQVLRSLESKAPLSC
ncbi:MAG: hypothetical protein L0Z53_12315 [Acidobacteriales bacterium]|nr:hypothetical protein [Terriglobales bacterium]